MNCLWGFLLGIHDEVDEHPINELFTFIAPVHPRQNFVMEYQRIASNDPEVREFSLWNVEMMARNLPLVRNSLTKNTRIQVLAFSLGSSGSTHVVIRNLFHEDVRYLPVSTIEISFHNSKIDATDLNRITRGLWMLPGLRVLDFSDGTLSDSILDSQDTYQHHGTCVPCLGLVEIRMSHNRLTNESSFGNFVKFLAQSCELKRLIASGNHFVNADRLLTALGENVRSAIQVLDLSQSSVDFVAIIEGFPSLRKLTLNSSDRSGELHGRMLTTIRLPPSLKELSLRRCGLCNSDAADLATILRSNTKNLYPRLDVLDLQSNLIDEKWLIETLEGPPLCRTLNLSHCQVQRGEAILGALWESDHTEYWRRLDLSWNQISPVAERDISFWMDLNELALAPTKKSRGLSTLWKLRGTQAATREDILFHLFACRPDIAMRLGPS